MTGISLAHQREGLSASRLPFVNKVSAGLSCDWLSVNLTPFNPSADTFDPHHAQHGVIDMASPDPWFLVSLFVSH